MVNLTLSPLILFAILYNNVFSNIREESDNLFDDEDLLLNTNTQVKYVSIKNLTDYDYSINIKNYDKDIQNYLNELELTVYFNRISCCLMLFRNLLDIKSNIIEKTIKESKFSKEDTFKKIYYESIDTCVNKLNELNDKTLESKILDPKEVLNSSDLSTIYKFISFETKRFKIMGPIPALNDQEKKIKEDIKQLYNKEKNLDFNKFKSSSNIYERNIYVYKGRGLYISIGFLLGVVVSIILKMLVFNRKYN